jgi:hypothetical protein
VHGDLTEIFSVIRRFFGHCRDLAEKISVNSLITGSKRLFRGVQEEIEEKISAKSARNDEFAGITEKISVRSKRGAIHFHGKRLMDLRDLAEWFFSKESLGFG